MTPRLALIPGDGIGPDVTQAALHIAKTALARLGLPAPAHDMIHAGAAYYREAGRDIEQDGEARAGAADAIFLGAIGLPSVRAADGTEISPHLRLRDIYELYAGVRPVRAYPGAPQALADPRAGALDFVILRESTEGLFYSAAVHDRSEVIGNTEVRETLRITRSVTQRLSRFAFRLGEKRQARGRNGRVTCVDKANVFASMAFFRSIFDEVAAEFPTIPHDYAYVDAMALSLVKRPWEAGVLVMENMFGDILSDLAGGLVGGMGMAPCGEYGDNHALFQPAHGSAPDIIGQDKANPLAAVLSGALMLEYLGERLDKPAYGTAAEVIEAAVAAGFADGSLRPMEFGGDMGLRAMVARLAELVAVIDPEAAA